MNFNYSAEQSELQTTLQRFIAKEYGFEQRRAIARSVNGFSRRIWQQFAELGLLALPLPEQYEGLGGSAVDTMIVMQELGRGLVVEPYIHTAVVAAGLIRDEGSDVQKEDILPKAGAGNLLLVLAHYEPDSRYETSHVRSSATPSGEGWVINGSKAVVMGGSSADKLVVSVRTAGDVRAADGISLFIIDANAAGVVIRSYATHDGQRAAEVSLNQVHVGPDALIGKAGQALPAIERALDYGIAALCAEATGIMLALNEVTLEYLKTRKQFGVPIGKFQALQHRMADMTIAAEQARSMTMLAALRADSTDAAERRNALSAAKAYIGQSGRFIGQQAVQLHGGMGVTDELNVSHYFKRLTMINATFGDADFHLGRFSDALLTA
jgi:alkylation response protein AidB-like acyl-CoA dehydrogenase